MKKKGLAAAVLVIMFAFSINARAGEQTPLKDERDRLSYSFGMSFGTNLRKQSIDINPEIYFRGLMDAYKGGETLMSDSEVREIIAGFQKEMAAKQETQIKALAEKNRKEEEAFFAENKKKEGVKTLPSGLQYKVLREGSGEMPRAADVITVNYRGTLLDGTEFDSSYKKGEPVTLRVNTAIPGWVEALQLMKENSKWQVFIPSNLAYGERAVSSVIGPNSALVFEVELVKVESSSASQADSLAGANPALGAPKDLKLAVVPEGIKLTWKPSAQDPDGVTGYEIFRSDFANGPFAEVGAVQKGVVEFTDKSASGEIIYYYKVRAVAGKEHSDYSNPVAGEKVK